MTLVLGEVGAHQGPCTPTLLWGVKTEQDLATEPTVLLSRSHSRKGFQKTEAANLQAPRLPGLHGDQK